MLSSLHVFSSVFWCLLRFAHKKLCSICLESHLLCRGFMFYLCYLYLFMSIGAPHEHFKIFNAKSCILSIFIVYPWKFVRPLHLKRLVSFLAHLAKGHGSFCHHLVSVVRHRPSIVRRKLSHLNLLLWNRWTKLNLTCSCIARSSLTYIPGFSVKFFFQPIYTDYAN